MDVTMPAALPGYANRQASPLRLVADSLDVVSIGVKNEGAVIVWVIMGPETGRAVIRRAGRNGRVIEAVDGVLVLG